MAIHNNAPETKGREGGEPRAASGQSNTNARKARPAAGLGWWHAVLWPVAVLTGMAIFAFEYGEGHAYFGTDPEACANCHIMRPRLDSYLKASHHAAATCVDCHLPDAFLPKSVAKVRNGWNHAVAFTTGRFEEPILISASNARVLQENCLACHGDLVHDLVTGGELRCVRCHVTVGHGERAGLGGPMRAAAGAGQAARVETRANVARSDGT